MNQDARRIAARLQAAIRGIDRDLDALRQAPRLHAATGKTQREPGSAAGAALPLKSQRSLVADCEGIAHLLPRRELSEIKRGRVRIQLCLWRFLRWSHLHSHGDLRVPAVGVNRYRGGIDLLAQICCSDERVQGILRAVGLNGATALL